MQALHRRSFFLAAKACSRGFGDTSRRNRPCLALPGLAWNEPQVCYAPCTAASPHLSTSHAETWSTGSQTLLRAGFTAPAMDLTARTSQVMPRLTSHVRMLCGNRLGMLKLCQGRLTLSSCWFDGRQRFERGCRSKYQLKVFTS